MHFTLRSLHASHACLISADCLRLERTTDDASDMFSRRKMTGGAEVEEGAENWQVVQISVWSPAVGIFCLPKPTRRSVVPVPDLRLQLLRCSQLRKRSINHDIGNWVIMQRGLWQSLMS
jgi:hypothetical protein